MSIFDKISFSNFFGLADDYDDYEEFEDREPVRQPAPKKAVQQQPNYRTVNQQNRGPVRPQPAARPTTRQSRPVQSTSAPHKFAKVERPVEDNVVSMHNPTQQTTSQRTTTQTRRSEPAPKSTHKIAIKEPRVYSESMEIGKLVLGDEAVLVNFHLMEEGAARRVIDFLTGIVFAVDGDIQRVGNEIFLCTPANMEIDGDTARSLLHEQNFDF
ncbi:MAG: cell division protein SepF [Lactobacillales bacterium]|jgi:cell division inhibitor SepF|nr:cell division protein SepF [Lactobacillales bacterium]